MVTGHIERIEEASAKPFAKWSAKRHLFTMHDSLIHS
jgi:hypothetical protein